MWGRRKELIFLLNADSRKSRIVASVLRQDRYRVIGATHRWSLLARVCRGYDFLFRCPPSNDPFFVKWLITKVRETNPAVLLVSSEPTINVIQKHRSILEQFVKVGLPEPSLWREVSDKYSVYKAAREVGVPVPRTVLLSANSNHIPDTAFRFPVILKPRWGWGGYGVYRVESESSLNAIVPRLRQDYILQEFVHGYGIGACVLIDRQGQVLLSFSFRRILEWPPEGGPSVLREAIYSPEILARAIRLLKYMGFWGLAMVEFRGFLEKNEYYLLEVNPRIWGSIDLAVAARANFPARFVEMLLGKSVSSQQLGKRSHVVRLWLPGLIAHICKRPFSILQVLERLELRDMGLPEPCVLGLLLWMCDSAIRYIHLWNEKNLSCT